MSYTDTSPPGSPVPTPPQPLRSLGTSIRALSDKWGWFIALGALYVAVGMLALGSQVAATVASVLFIGAMMTIAGIGEVIAAFQMKSWGRFAIWMLAGLMYIAGGIIAFVNPLLAAASLTLVLAIVLMISGVLRGYLAFQMKEGSSWGWVLFSAAVTVALGLMILMRWPVSGLYTLGIFMAVDLLFAGFGWISTGLAVRRLTDGK